ncbi:hypothetical protein [Paenibacillus sp. FSL R7-0128]|uniref:hypothetical protein n=1 Tax=Paenibacillus sp. FSL R7-0128 TaxID=2954529 RepID=UPI0030F65F57
MYDYKAEFHEAVTDLIAQDIVERSERMAAVHALTDAYFDSVGEYPDTAEIERLTDYILREELTDRHPDKVTREEYPFFSAWQLELRRDKETSDSAAEFHGQDGRDHRAPIKRKRTAYERWKVDAGAKIRNQARAARYKRDTAPGRVITYNLRETGGELSDEFTQRRGIGGRWLASIEALPLMSAVNEITVEPAEEHVREAA